MTDTRTGRLLGWLNAALLAVPILGSLGVLLAAFAWLGRWTGLPVLIWLTAAPLLRTVRGERLYLCTDPGVGRLSDAQWTLLKPIASELLARCELDPRRIDWYVRSRDAGVNAYATGRRSVALSAGMLQALAAGSLAAGLVAGALAHEVGHLHDPATARRIVLAWLTGPWRIVQTLLTRMLHAVASHTPATRAAAVLLPVTAVIAGIQLTHQHEWRPLAVLVGLASLVIVNPLVNAAVSRRAELAADDYAADLGHAEALAALLGQRQTKPGGLFGDLYASHPPVARRVERLTAAGR